MANYLEDLTGVLQGFGAAGTALLVVPVLITLLARDVPRALYTSLLSFASFILLVAPASAVSALAILSGLGSLVLALESIIVRRRVLALDKQIVDLSSRLNQLESTEQRRLMLEVAGWTKKGRRRSQPKPSHQADHDGQQDRRVWDGQQQVLRASQRPNDDHGEPMDKASNAQDYWAVSGPNSDPAGFRGTHDG
jgi:hypothetical protein